VVQTIKLKSTVWFFWADPFRHQKCLFFDRRFFVLQPVLAALTNYLQKIRNSPDTLHGKICLKNDRLDKETFIKGGLSWQPQEE